MRKKSKIYCSDVQKNAMISITLDWEGRCEDGYSIVAGAGNTDGGVYRTADL